MTIMDNLKSKDYYLHLAIIAVSVLLFNETISSWLVNKLTISLPLILISFLSLFIIIGITDLISESILDI